MPGKFQFVSAFLCEKVLMEADGVLSAIRMVDIFGVPENAPPDFGVSFFVVATFKTLPGRDAEYNVRLNFIRASGEKAPGIVELPPQKAALFENDPSIATGISIISQMLVRPQNLGTCQIEIEIDGEVEARIPFTLRLSGVQVPSQGS